jgi:DNA polymerase I-like protein with 3'-5' exonuclease and polymerase domains
MFACCEQAGGSLSAQFNQAATQTHRLSSTGLDFGMQFQNFPRQYKPLFKARHSGWLVGEVDGAQLEFRDAVHLGRDATGLYDIMHGTDIHSVTASVIWPNENPKDRRQDAKPHTFKPLYGGRSGTPAEKRYYEFFREKYKGITQWQNGNIDYVLNHKYLVTEWGLRFYWPSTRMDRSGYVTNSTAICNYPVQCHATAEIIPISLIWFWHRLKRSGLKMFIVNTIHDAILCEMPPEEVNDFHNLSRQCLIADTYRTLRDLYGCKFTVPLGAGVKVARHWAGKDAVDFVPVGVKHDKGEVKYEAPEEFWLQNAKEAGMIK